MADSSDDYLTIDSTVIDEVSQVRFYEETVDHINEQHPEVKVELPSIFGAVTSTLTNPTHVERSYGTSYVFVDANSTNASGDPLRVPVKVISGTSSVVKTAFFASTTGERDIIWRESDE